MRRRRRAEKVAPQPPLDRARRCDERERKKENGDKGKAEEEEEEEDGTYRRIADDSNLATTMR